MTGKAFAALLALLLIGVCYQAHAETPSLPSLPDTKITVPWDRFMKMVEELAGKPAPPEAPPPAEVSVGRTTYTMRLESGRLESSATIEVATFGKGWHELFITGRDTPLVSLTVDGADALTLVRADGVWVAMPGQGKRTIHAVVVCDAPDTPGPHTVTITGPDAATRSVDLSYPRNFTGVGVGGVVTAATPGRVSSVLAGGGAVTVSYTVAAERAAGVPGKTVTGPPEIIAEVFSVLDIEEEATFLKTRIAYEVRNAPMRSVRVRLPKDYDLLDVTGDGVSSWRVSEDETELAVSVGYDVIGSWGLVLSFEKSKTEETRTLPFPKVGPVGAERTMGFLAVVSGGGFEVTEAKSELLTARDPSELPEAILSLSELPPVLAYRFTRPEFSLSLAVGKGRALSALSAFVDSANSVVLVTTDGKMVVRTNYFVRNRSLQFLKITLPARSVFWSATVRGAPVRSSTDRDGVVMIPLPMGAGNAADPFVVSVVIFVPVPEASAAGRLALPLPSLDIPTGEMMATFYLPEGLSYLSFGGDMEQIEYFSEVLAPEAKDSFVSENLRLRKSVYERQEDLENAINEQERLIDTGAGVPTTPEGFDLPLRGKVFRFVKLIAMGEETGVRAVYIDRRLVIILVMLGAALGGVLLLRFRGVLRAIFARPGGRTRAR